MCLGRVSEVYRVFKLMARMRVRMPLAMAETVGISQTPFRPKRGVRMNRQEMGKNNVPKKDTSKDRPGRSSAVKYDEKHMSIQPTR